MKPSILFCLLLCVSGIFPPSAKTLHAEEKAAQLYITFKPGIALDEAEMVISNEKATIVGDKEENPVRLHVTIPSDRTAEEAVKRFKQYGSVADATQE